MLYISTRNKSDISTAHRTIQTNRPVDGGCYIPYNLSAMEDHAIRQLKEQPFGRTVSKILNLFFSATAQGLDIDFLADQYSVKLAKLNHRIVVAEAWHNLDSDYETTMKAFCSHIFGEKVAFVSEWAGIAARVATLFGIYGEMKRAGELSGSESFDVTVNAGDFTEPMACWYARRIGLPINNIICTCNENGAVWDFLKRGELNGGQSVIRTSYPRLDYSVPSGLERLVCEVLGHQEAIRFSEIMTSGKTYRAGEQAGMLTEGFFGSVVSSGRIEQVIRSVYRSAEYILDPYSAFSYAGLQDYRAKTGESRVTLLIAEQSPVLFSKQVCNACGISEETLKKAIR